jgi:acyl transferase domain-containing protein
MNEANQTAAPEGIAVIGMSGRFPGAGNVDQFWRNLVQGVESISHFAEQELEHSVATAEAIVPGQKFIRARAIIKDADLFDATFFGIYPKEAQLMDPQHRLFLECAWEALESAGHSSETYPGLIGVYAGLSMNTYLLHNICADRAFASDFTGNYQVGAYQTMLGNDKDFMPTRVSYKLNLRGPSMTIQSACSTSLVAICQACTSLMTYQCDMALAGGVSITFPQKRDYLYQEEGMVSADGTCRTFDASACGTVFGHGVAVVLLKRLDDAIADGDPILAVIKGTAVNNDGSDKIGYAAPSVKAQADVIAMAQSAASIDPETVSYIEAHGTATPLGDPIEVAALTEAFRRGGSLRNQYCALSSAKTNVGHLDIAAGATGLIKTVLQLQNELIPPLLHFKSANPKIDFANSPFFPVSKPLDWKRGTSPRRAGVSAFGVGGTNAHVVIEEAPQAEPSSPSRKYQLLLFSAKTDAALQNMSERLAASVEAHLDTPLADVAFTLHRGRQRFKHRRALCAGSAAEVVEGLRNPDAKTTFTGQAPSRPPSLVFLFPGQGAQYVNMGRELYDSEPEFRGAVDKCADCLLGHLQVDIRSVLYPDAAAKVGAVHKINETWLTQPSIFVVEYALARLWMAWGIKPSVVIGHSVGEYVAAVLAGVFSLEEALGLLAARAKLMQDLPSGSMLAVRRGAAELAGLVPDDVAIAAVNSPSLTTLSGPAPALGALQEHLEGREIASRFLPTSHAFHSAMMDPIVEPFTELARRVRQHKPSLPWISSFTGTWMNEQLAPEASYWAAQLRHTVRFGQAVETAIQYGEVAFLEVGPGQALTQFVRQQPSKPVGLTLLTSFSAKEANPQDLATMLTSLGRLWLLGCEPDWDGFYAAEKRRRVSLPTYPFERQRYWIQPPTQGNRLPSSQDLHHEAERNSGDSDQSITVQNGTKLSPMATALFQAINQLPVLEDARSNARRLIEKQIQLMTQQLELLRNRGVTEGLDQ